MASGFGSSDEEVISGINITPLVDVILVLLIIFMITAPTIYQSAFQIKLPQAQSADSTPHTPLHFTVNQAGELMWNQEHIAWESLSNRLKSLNKNLTEESALISADEKTPHGVVVRLIDQLKSAGLARFALDVQNHQ
ncbi:biopolymer transporter ExbD [bacterium]|nr:biopolymer transporter ExbD [bacterium]